MPTRRRFLQAAAPLGALALAPPVLGRAVRGALVADGPFSPLRRGVGYFVGQGGTIGYLATAGALVVVDAQMPASAATCRAGLAGMTPRPVDVLVNTHHHGDHTGGNGAFGAARRVAHVAVPGLQRAQSVQRGTYDAQVYPTETFEDAWRADVGGETVHATYAGPAHTAGDAVVRFERANVVHTGDLVFNRRPAVIDLPGGASTAGWIATLDRLHAATDADTIFVFGHAGPSRPVTGSRADLLVMRDFLGALREAVQRGIAAGRSADEIAAAGLPAFPDHTLPDRPDALAANLRTVHQELTRR